METAQIVALGHTLLMLDGTARKALHQGQVEAADLRIALGQGMKHAVIRFDRIGLARHGAAGVIAQLPNQLAQFGDGFET